MELKEVVEVYGEGSPAELLNAFEAYILESGGKRLTTENLVEAEGYTIAVAPRGSIASLRLQGEDIFHNLVPATFIELYCKNKNCAGGSLRGIDELVSVNLDWAEFKGAKSTTSVTNQLTYMDIDKSWDDLIRKVLKRKPWSEIQKEEEENDDYEESEEDTAEYTMFDALKLIDAKWGALGEAVETRSFGPGIVAWPERLLSKLVKKGIASNSNFAIPGFIHGVYRPARQVRNAQTGEVGSVAASYRIGVENYFKQQTNSEKPEWTSDREAIKLDIDPKALRAEIDELSSAILALKPLQQLNVANELYFQVASYGAYEGRNPRTGEVIRTPAKKVPFCRKIRK